MRLSVHVLKVSRIIGRHLGCSDGIGALPRHGILILELFSVKEFERFIAWLWGLLSSRPDAFLERKRETDWPGRGSMTSP